MYPVNTDHFIPKIKLTDDDKDAVKYLYEGKGDDMLILNETDQNISWFAFNSNDLVKAVALHSGNLGAHNFSLYKAVKNGTGKYFIRFTRRGGGPELAGGIVSADSTISIISSGSRGYSIQIT
jgi:hypothetical protein